MDTEIGSESGKEEWITQDKEKDTVRHEWINTSDIKLDMMNGKHKMKRTTNLRI